MRTLLKVISIVSIIIGGIAFFGSLVEEDLAGTFGGIYWIAYGGLVLAYISQNK